jgi:predicted metal-binding protein
VLVLKIGIIRCQQTEDMCPGTMDFKIIREKKGAFEGVEEDIEIIGMVSCGGCPGKKVITRARDMVKRGADTIVLASCINRGNPVGIPCPHAAMIEGSIKNKLDENIQIINYTH